MKRTVLNLAALAVVAAGAHHLHAQTASYAAETKCCTATFGSRCCGVTCQAGWFECTAG